MVTKEDKLIWSISYSMIVTFDDDYLSFSSPGESFIPLPFHLYLRAKKQQVYKTRFAFTLYFCQCSYKIFLIMEGFYGSSADLVVQIKSVFFTIESLSQGYIHEIYNLWNFFWKNASKRMTSSTLHETLSIKDIFEKNIKTNEFFSTANVIDWSNVVRG